MLRISPSQAALPAECLPVVLGCTFVKNIILYCIAADLKDTLASCLNGKCSQKSKAFISAISKFREICAAYSLTQPLGQVIQDIMLKQITPTYSPIDVHKTCFNMFFRNVLPQDVSQYTFILVIRCPFSLWYKIIWFNTRGGIKNLKKVKQV